jgi:hypothetical protein
MSPEERAKAALEFIGWGCGLDACKESDCPSCGCMAYLATAIREAEDAAYERAAENMRQLAIHLEHAMDTLTDAERTPAVIGAYVREWSLTPLKSQEP